MACFDFGAKSCPQAKLRYSSPADIGPSDLSAVERIPFDDHQACSLEVIQTFCLKAVSLPPLRIFHRSQDSMLNLVRFWPIHTKDALKHDGGAGATRLLLRS